MIPLPKPAQRAEVCDGPGPWTPRVQCTGLCWQWDGTGLTYVAQAWGSEAGAGAWVGAVCMGWSAYGAPASPPGVSPCPCATLFLPRQTNVSTERLERYLGGEDLDTSAIHHSPVAGRLTSRLVPVGDGLAQPWAPPALRDRSLLTGSAVRFSEATFAWEQDGNAAIRE